MAEYTFVKEAGRELVNQKGETNFCNSLQKELDSLKLNIEPLNINLKDDIIYVSGKVPDQSILERIVLFLGNTKGVSKVNTCDLHVVSSVVPNKVTRFYEVKPKDSLWTIAEKIYGITHGDKYKIIFEANKPMMSEPDDLFVGQTLRIPNIDVA